MTDSDFYIYRAINLKKDDTVLSHSYWVAIPAKRKVNYSFVNISLNISLVNKRVLILRLNTQCDNMCHATDPLQTLKDPEKKITITVILYLEFTLPMTGSYMHSLG